MENNTNVIFKSGNIDTIQQEPIENGKILFAKNGDNINLFVDDDGTRKNIVDKRINIPTYTSLEQMNSNYTSDYFIDYTFPQAIATICQEHQGSFKLVVNSTARSNNFVSICVDQYVAATGKSLEEGMPILIILEFDGFNNGELMPATLGQIIISPLDTFEPIRYYFNLRVGQNNSFQYLSKPQFFRKACLTEDGGILNGPLTLSYDFIQGDAPSSRQTRLERTEKALEIYHEDTSGIDKKFVLTAPPDPVIEQDQYEILTTANYLPLQKRLVWENGTPEDSFTYGTVLFNNVPLAPNGRPLNPLLILIEYKYTTTSSHKQTAVVYSGTTIHLQTIQSSSSTMYQRSATVSQLGNTITFEPCYGWNLVTTNGGSGQSDYLIPTAIYAIYGGMEA